MFLGGGWPPCVCAYLYFRISLRSCHYAYSKNTVRVNWAATYVFGCHCYPTIILLLPLRITHHYSKKTGTRHKVSVALASSPVSLSPCCHCCCYMWHGLPQTPPAFCEDQDTKCRRQSLNCWVWPLSRKHLYRPTCRLLSPTPTSHPHPTMMPVLVLLNRTFHSNSSKLWMCRFNWQANVYRTKEARGRHGQAASSSMPIQSTNGGHWLI